METYVIVIMVVGWLASTGVMLYAFKLSRTRKQALTKFTEEAFFEKVDDPTDVGEQFRFAQLMFGKTLDLRNVMRRQDGRFETVLMERWQVGAGRNNQTRSFVTGAIGVTSAEMALPRFIVRPLSVAAKAFKDERYDPPAWAEKFGEKLQEMLPGTIRNGDPVIFGDPFDQQFAVRVLDGSVEEVRDLLDERVRDSLLQSPAVTVEGQGQRLLVYEYDKRIDTGDVDSLIELAHALAHRLGTSDW